jgi:hypothetical protein
MQQSFQLHAAFVLGKTLAQYLTGRKALWPVCAFSRAPSRPDTGLPSLFATGAERFRAGAAKD